jgi:hypothetical protein
MARTAIATLVIAAFVGLSGSALAAARLTSADLLTVCTDKAAASQTACKFYIVGVAEGLEMGTQDPTDKVCVPGDTSSDQLQAAFVTNISKALGLDQSNNGIPAAEGVAAALDLAYPCPNP